MVGLVAVLAGMAGALREPLSGQVSTASRPRSASAAALFGNVLVVVAAVVAVYRSSVATGDPDWVVLVGPALIGLAVGGLVVWLVRVGARLALGRTANGSLTGFLAVRRLARVADAATALRVLVAATVVAAVAVTGAAQVGDWTGDTARLRAGAPLQVPLDGDAAGALELTRDLDPDGHWLMAAVLVPGEGSVVARRAFLDLSRFDAVLGDFYAGTPAAGLARDVAALTGGEGPGTGSTVTATVRGVSARRTGVMRPRVKVGYRDSTGSDRHVVVRLRVAQDGRPVTAHAPLEGCDTGCVVTSVTLARSPGDTTLPWVLTGLRARRGRRDDRALAHQRPELVRRADLPGPGRRRAARAVDVQAADRPGHPDRHDRAGGRDRLRHLGRQAAAGLPGGRRAQRRRRGPAAGAAAGRGRRAAGRPAAGRRRGAADRPGRPGHGAGPRGHPDPGARRAGGPGRAPRGDRWTRSTGGSPGRPARPRRRSTR